MLKITGGFFRGRKIQAPKGRHTRPTAEKVRQSLFNVLEHMDVLDGARVVDLFAGSGALGIEALSRGAAHVTFVESHGRTAALVRENLISLEIPPDQWRVETKKAEVWLGQIAENPAPLILLADPPYAGDLAATILVKASQTKAVAAGTIVVVECDHRNPPPIPGNLELLQVKSYGDTDVIYSRKFTSPQGLEG